MLFKVLGKGLIKKHLLLQLLIICWLILLVQVNAQDLADSGYGSYIKNTAVHDAKHIFNLGLAFIQSPLHFDTSDWHTLLYATASTSATFLVDRDMKEFALSGRSSFNDNIFKIDDYLRGQTGTYAGALLYLTGFFSKEQGLRLTGLYTLETLLLAESITGTLKYTFGRRRPYGGKDHMDFKLFRGNKGVYRSLPSGHTTGAFAFATVMAMSLENTYWKVFWYGSAGMVGLARVYHNAHWFSDTVLAAFISYNVADFVVHFDEGQSPENSSMKTKFSIYAGPGQIGIKLNF